MRAGGARHRHPREMIQDVIRVCGGYRGGIIVRVGLIHALEIPKGIHREGPEVTLRVGDLDGIGLVEVGRKAAVRRRHARRSTNAIVSIGGPVDSLSRNVGHGLPVNLGHRRAAARRVLRLAFGNRGRAAPRIRLHRASESVVRTLDPVSIGRGDDLWGRLAVGDGGGRAGR